MKPRHLLPPILIFVFAVASFQVPQGQLFAAERGTPVQSSQASDSGFATESGAVAPTRSNRKCFAIGPIRDKARAIEIAARYAGRQVATELKTSLDKIFLGVMVYIDGHATRADARETAAALAAAGIHDHIIINPEGRMHLLSLGVFGSMRNAERLKARVEQLGFAARTEIRFHEREVYYLDGEHSGGGELHDVLDAREIADGIEPIPITCPPD